MGRRLPVGVEEDADVDADVDVDPASRRDGDAAAVLLLLFVGLRGRRGDRAAADARRRLGAVSPDSAVACRSVSILMNSSSASCDTASLADPFPVPLPLPLLFLFLLHSAAISWYNCNLNSNMTYNVEAFPVRLVLGENKYLALPNFRPPAFASPWSHTGCKFLCNDSQS